MPYLLQYFVYNHTSPTHKQVFTQKKGLNPTSKLNQDQAGERKPESIVILILEIILHNIQPIALLLFNFTMYIEHFNL